MIICDSNHIYRDTETGLTIPNVTSILEKAGLVDFSMVNPEKLKRAQDFGKAVHLACHLYDKHNLDMGSLDPALKPYLEDWIKWKKDSGFLIDSSEKIVYSKIYNYAGTYDRVGLLDGVRTLIDIKTGTTLPKTIALQIAAYMGAANEGRKMADKIKRRLSIWLLGDGQARPAEYKERTDFRVFTSCLNIMNWKKINNIKENK